MRSSSLGVECVVTLDPIKDGVNCYAYVENRPTVAVDPSGLAESDSCVEDFKKGGHEKSCEGILDWCRDKVEDACREHCMIPCRLLFKESVCKTICNLAPTTAMCVTSGSIGCLEIYAACKICEKKKCKKSKAELDLGFWSMVYPTLIHRPLI